MKKPLQKHFFNGIFKSIFPFNGKREFLKTHYILKLVRSFLIQSYQSGIGVGSKCFQQGCQLFCVCGPHSVCCSKLGKEHFGFRSRAIGMAATPIQSAWTGGRHTFQILWKQTVHQMSRKSSSSPEKRNRLWLQLRVWIWNAMNWCTVWIQFIFICLENQSIGLWKNVFFPNQICAVHVHTPGQSCYFGLIMVEVGFLNFFIF